MIVEKELIIPDRTGRKRATLYQADGSSPRAVILYLHGGALIYGSRGDLPDTHKNALCGAGYALIAVDYPLCPEARLPQILADVLDTVAWYLDTRKTLFGWAPGYFLFGRSAGARYPVLLRLRPFMRRLVRCAERILPPLSRNARQLPAKGGRRC